MGRPPEKCPETSPRSPPWRPDPLMKQQAHCPALVGSLPSSPRAFPYLSAGSQCRACGSSRRSPPSCEETSAPSAPSPAFLSTLVEALAGIAFGNARRRPFFHRLRLFTLYQPSLFPGRPVLQHHSDHDPVADHILDLRLGHVSQRYNRHHRIPLPAPKFSVKRLRMVDPARWAASEPIAQRLVPKDSVGRKGGLAICF